MSRRASIHSPFPRPGVVSGPPRPSYGLWGISLFGWSITDLTPPSGWASSFQAFALQTLLGAAYRTVVGDADSVNPTRHGPLPSSGFGMEEGGVPPHDPPNVSPLCHTCHHTQTACERHKEPPSTPQESWMLAGHHMLPATSCIFLFHGCGGGRWYHMVVLIFIYLIVNEVRSLFFFFKDFIYS